MKNITEQIQVLVIGGGVVGCSCLYHLAEKGISNSLLVERDELTSGSTWHAAGNLPTFSTSWSLLYLQKYSAWLYKKLATDVAYPINYHITASVRLAHRQSRMDEFTHVLSMAKALELDYELLDTKQLKQRYPFIETHDLLGALWDPYDGDIDPAQLTQALAYHAKQKGARIERHRRVTGLETTAQGDWLVNTDKGPIRAEVVINAAGYRAHEIMAMLGRKLPLTVMSHQYLVSEDLPELAALEQKLPLLRDPDTSYYLRQERQGLILGPYEWQATPMWQQGLPEDFAYQLWNDDFDRLESYIQDAIARVPLLGKVGIKRAVNGPIPYSPDGNPYIGPEPGLTNFFHCNCFSFGITQGGGAGKVLAEWVVDGKPSPDMWVLERRRYGDYADSAYCEAKAIEVYQNEYRENFPYEERPAGRPLIKSPLYDVLAQKGARFGARGGYERAVYFDLDQSLPEEQHSFRRDHHVWRAVVSQEVAAVRNNVGVLNLGGFSKFELEGAGCTAFLDHLLCSKLPKIGRIALTYALSADGKLWSEFTVSRLAEECYWLISAAAAHDHDLDLLNQQRPSSVTLRDHSRAFSTLVIAGPKAREVLAGLTATDLSNTNFAWLSAKPMRVANVEVLAMRVNYVGELGWELHVPSTDLTKLYNAIWEAGAAYGIRDFGLYAMDSLRIDKCYRGWKTDLESSYSPFEASLDRFIDLDKAAFIGKTALLAEKQRGIRRKLMPLVFDDGCLTEAPYCAQVFATSSAAGEPAGANIGLITSSVWSFTLNCSIALAYLSAEHAKIGNFVDVEILGIRYRARVAQEPVYDVTNAKLRV